MNLISCAYAMGQAPAGEAGAGGGFGAFIPIIIMFAIFYILLIRPQQKKQKEHQEMVNNLRKGDRVITGGGIYGVITALDDSTVTLEVADNVRIKVTRGSIAALVPKRGQAASGSKRSGKGA